MNPSHNDFRELSEITEEHLNFRAIDSGLGFVPNARAKSEPAKAGSAAIVAGKPTFQNPAKQSPTAASPVTLPAAELHLRIAAFLTDLIFALTPWVAAFLWVSRSADADLLLKADSLLFSAFFVFTYFLLTESLGGQSPGKMIFGLRTVEDDKYEKPIGFRRALTRIFGLVAGTVFFGFGLILALIDHKRRPWHDKLSGSIVRRKLY